MGIGTGSPGVSRFKVNIEDTTYLVVYSSGGLNQAIIGDAAGTGGGLRSEITWKADQSIRSLNMGDVDAAVNGKSILLDDAAATLSYTANSGHTFTGNVGIGTTPDSSNLKTGSVSLGYHKVTANNYLTQPGDYTLSVDNGASNWNVYLPTAAGNPGRVIVVKRYDDNSNGSINVMATGGSVQDTDGTFGSSIPVSAWATAQMMFQSNGTNWELIK